MYVDAGVELLHFTLNEQFTSGSTVVAKAKIDKIYKHMALRIHIILKFRKSAFVVAYK